MEDDKNNEDISPEAKDVAAKPEKKKSLWRIVRWPVYALGAFLVLFLGLLTFVSLYLTPERMAGLVKKFGSDYLVEGKADVSRIDLTVWSSFPHVELQVDSLALLNLRPQVPDTVVAVDRFEGRLNPWALLLNKVSISHVSIERPRVTLWFGPDSTINSLSIFPSKEEEKKEKAEAPKVPDISIDRFVIEGTARLRYASVPDSIDATVEIQRTTLQGEHGTPRYAFKVNGGLGVFPFLTDKLTYGIDGAVKWQPKEPLAFELDKFRVDIDKLQTVSDMALNFDTARPLRRFKLEVKPITVNDLMAVAAKVPQLKAALPAVKSHGKVKLSAALQSPWNFKGYPAVKARAEISDAPLQIPEYYVDFSSFGADVAINVSPKGLDASRVDVHKLSIAFPGSEINVNGSAVNLQSDAHANGVFKGAVDFGGLDPRVWTLLGMRMWGKLDADIDFDARLSDLTPNTFHRIMLKGDANLKNFRALIAGANPFEAGLRNATVEFGSAGKFVKYGRSVDSLLTVSVSVDTAWASMPELKARLGKLKMGVGVENKARSFRDPKGITPMGARITLGTLRYTDMDSTRAMLRNVSGGIGLTRYQGSDRRPKLNFDLTVGRALMAMGSTRMALKDCTFAASAFKSGDKPRRPRNKSAQDRALLNAKGEQRHDDLARLDVGVDRATVRLLRRWNLSGTVKAKGGRLITPLWPLRTTMSNLDFGFNADSLNLRTLNVKTGQSDFALSGTVSNIQQALGRRRVHEPLLVRLNLNSGRVNVNELVQTAFRGAAASGDKGATASLDMSEAAMEQQAEKESSDEIRAIVVPDNIDASLKVKAGKILYSDVELRNLSGAILIANGAAVLHNLQASTDVGSAELNMLYSAPAVNDVEFGLGLKLKRFNIGGVTQMLPMLDSITPMLSQFGGIVDADVSATTKVDSLMNVNFPSLKAMVRLQGDSLVVLDPKTFKKISRWLLFKNKNKNMIDHMDVSMAVEDNMLKLYPFMFDFDRYRLGVMGHNDMNMNLNYHISVLKSPIPFKFGINVKGTLEKMKIRLGGAKYKEGMAAQSVAIGDTVRLNLAREMMQVFRRGARKARLSPLKFRAPSTEMPKDDGKDGGGFTGADSLLLRQEGLIQ